MTIDPTLARAAADAMNQFTDHLFVLPWPHHGDPAAVRDFLSGVAGYSNSLAGLPIQAELEDRLAVTTTERDALAEALRVAINTVECASLGRDGQPLPWYRMARAALGSAWKVGDSWSAGAATTEPDEAITRAGALMAFVKEYGPVMPEWIFDTPEARAAGIASPDEAETSTSNAEIEAMLDAAKAPPMSDEQVDRMLKKARDAGAATTEPEKGGES